MVIKTCYTFRLRKSSSLVMVLSTTIFFAFVLLFVPLEAQILCNQNDRDSLLEFSYNLSSSSLSSLNWSSAVDCCNWEGVECDGSNGRVIGLRLPWRGLAGVLSPSLANLTRLSHLNLSHNRLSGALPFSFLSRTNSLEVIDLSYNRLVGELPAKDGGSVAKIPVQVVDLSSNQFSGEINPNKLFLQAAWNLTVFNVSNNSFTGLIPSGICLYLSRSVRILDFSYNDFSGAIPDGLGNCSGLQILRAGFNNLSGLIPDDIYRAVLLDQLSLPVNHLSGGISNSIGDLTNLKTLELYSNELTGTIPPEIGKLSELEKLLLHINNLTGSIPSSLMNCTRINTLNLRVNYLGGDLSSFDFSTMSKLSILDLRNNKFTGNLPTSLYSCTSLTAVRLATNQLQGQILPKIRALQSLSFLSISNNSLTNATGAIQILMGCRSLTTMVLANNFMHEAIPDNIDTLDMPGFNNIRVLGLGGCQFSGTIPSWLGKIRNLEVLDLSINWLSGPVPRWLGNLSSLFYFDLSNNWLSGKFPVELTRMTALVSNAAVGEIEGTHLELPVFVMPNNATNQQYNQLSNLPPAIYLGNNSLSGHIPVEIGQLKYLLVLDLSRNNFSGTIPDEISNLTNLEKLDLSGNDLSGEIPMSLRGLHFLSLFNVANNNLQGPIPSGNQFETFQSSSFLGNPGLCGPILHRSCSNPTRTDSFTRSQERVNTKLLVGLLVGICFGSGLLLALLVTWIVSKRRIIPGEGTDKVEMDMVSSNSFSIVPIDSDKDTSIVILFPNNGEEIKDLTMAELLKATDNFNQANIVGCGGFGLVYQATLENGTKLAVKKLSGDFGMMEREFRAEVEALSMAQHENLVSLQGYCVYEGFRLLVYSFMENGSLDYWLHEKVAGASQLDWPTRLKIARGASCGLAYMHQICEPHIIHRDIKSSNILLDEKFEAHVADFGLARLILPYHTHVTTELVGTLGYIPPEYGQAWVATFRGDIYSFGVVMLELLTGKRPVEVLKPKTRELVSWVQQMRNDGKQHQIYDPVMRDKGYEDEILQVLDVACLCVNQNPLKRPTIKQVVDWLENVGSQRDQDQLKQSKNTNHERM